LPNQHIFCFLTKQKLYFITRYSLISGIEWSENECKCNSQDIFWKMNVILNHITIQQIKIYLRILCIIKNEHRLYFHFSLIISHRKVWISPPTSLKLFFFPSNTIWVKRNKWITNYYLSSNNNVKGNQKTCMGENFWAKVEFLY
jgi:hypothetical protein